MQLTQEVEREPELTTLVTWVAFLALIAGWGIYLASTLGAVRYAQQADEAWYLRYATEVSTRGPGVFPGFFDRYLASESAQVYPNPLRVLFIVVSAIWCTIFGTGYAALSGLSLCSHLLTALVTFVAARDHFGRTRALVLAGVVAFSPLLSGLARRALMDSFATLTVVLAIWSFLAWTRDFASRKRAGLFALALAACLITKENHVLFVPSFAIFLAWLAFRRSRPVPWRMAAGALGIPIAIAGLVFALAAGGVEPVVRLARVIMASPSGNEYAIQFGSGPWYRYLIDFLTLSPWVTLAGLGGAAAVLLGRVEHGRDALEFFVVFVFVSLAIYGVLTKNVRYLTVLDVAWRALAVGFAFELVALFGPRVALWSGLALGAVSCVLDAVTFRTFFLAQELYDPISAALLGLRDIIPFRLRR